MSHHGRKGSSSHSKAPTVGQASSREFCRHYCKHSSQHAQASTVSVFRRRNRGPERSNNLLRDAQQGSWGACQAQSLFFTIQGHSQRGGAPLSLVLNKDSRFLWGTLQTFPLGGKGADTCTPTFRQSLLTIPALTRPWHREC